MKKIILFAVLYFALQAGIKAQSASYDSLNINNINARIWADNMNFWDHQSQAKYQVNYSGGITSSMFNQTLQIGGIDSLNQLYYTSFQYDSIDLISFPDTEVVFVREQKLKQEVDSFHSYYFNNTNQRNNTDFEIYDTYETDIVSEFIMYPNPASTSLYLKYSEDMIKAKYKVYDIAGRTIHEGFLNDKEITKISLKEINSGLYILVIDNGNQRITKKFIVNK